MYFYQTRSIFSVQHSISHTTYLGIINCLFFSWIMTVWYRRNRACFSYIYLGDTTITWHLAFSFLNSSFFCNTCNMNIKRWGGHDKSHLREIFIFFELKWSCTMSFNCFLSGLYGIYGIWMFWGLSFKCNRTMSNAHKDDMNEWAKKNTNVVAENKLKNVAAGK